jgi:hypothetical protein
MLTSLLTVLDKLDGLRGGAPAAGGGTGRTTGYDLIERGIEKLPEILDKVGENSERNLRAAEARRAGLDAQERTLHAARAAGGAGGVATAPPASSRLGTSPTPRAAQPGAPAAGPLRIVPVAPAGGAGGGDAMPPAVEVIPSNGTSIPGSAAEEDIFLNGVKRRIVNLIAQGEEPEFIVDFLEAARPDMIPYLVNYPPAQVTAYFSNDPILHAATEDPRWETVLAGARAYILESEPEPEPAGAGARRVQ